MIVRPKRRFPLSDPDGPLYVLPSRLGDGLWIECEVMGPKSSAGRNVMLQITPEMADDMLLELRTYAINRRRNPVESRVDD